MKELKYIMMALVCILMTGCMDGDYDEIERNSFAKVTKNLQIKGYVTGNDLTGNIYNEIWIQDETGAISFSISQGGICGYLPVGAEILVELKGLSVGNYRMQPVIGTPYTTVLTSGRNAGKEVTYVSRMNRMEWMNHFKITGGKRIIEPEVFAEGSTKTTWSMPLASTRRGTSRNSPPR